METVEGKWTFIGNFSDESGRTQRSSDRSAGFENSRELAFSNRHDERRIITLHTKYRVARLPLNANAIILPGVFVLQFNLRRPGNTFLLIAPADLSTP